jgi:hypothetical protein
VVASRLEASADLAPARAGAGPGPRSRSSSGTARRRLADRQTHVLMDERELGYEALIDELLGEALAVSV